ncbi:dTMP kinase [Kitasatospora sp. NPDC057904]|uniref:dTMP kinase n=1 Tax=unclassified Kitasatospora TaxID=2633591 RepID=UPI0036DF0006
MAFLPLSPRGIGNLQRVLLVALLSPALVITVLATVPALTVLPFLPDGTRRTVDLLRTHANAASALLSASRAER